MTESPVLNPAVIDWSGPHGLPQFERVGDEDYAPAFEAALKDHDAEIDAISDNPEPATFANTIVALEIAGDALEGGAAGVRLRRRVERRGEIDIAVRDMHEQQPVGSVAARLLVDDRRVADALRGIRKAQRAQRLPPAVAVGVEGAPGRGVALEVGVEAGEAAGIDQDRVVQRILDVVAVA